MQEFSGTADSSVTNPQKNLGTPPISQVGANREVPPSASPFHDSAPQGINLEEVSSRLWGLLRPTTVKIQRPDGRYWGNPFKIDEQTWNDRGVKTVALTVCHRDKAHFMTFDIDERFRERLPVFYDVLRRFGMNKAAFAGHGSTEGRGKVYVIFREPYSAKKTRLLAKRIIDAVKEDPRFGEVTRGRLQASVVVVSSEQCRFCRRR